MAGRKDIIKKICLLGDPAVGKTSLIRRYVYDTFDDKYITTIGTKVTKKSVQIDATSQGIGPVNITLLIWDILGQKEYARLHPVYYQGAEAALMVCDGTRPDTIESLNTWVEGFTKVVGQVPIIFMINKYDLIDAENFDTARIEALAELHGASFYFTSALTGENVEEAFYTICELLSKRLRH